VSPTGVSGRVVEFDKMVSTFISCREETTRGGKRRALTVASSAPLSVVID
jgi:hypothetical protein